MNTTIGDILSRIRNQIKASKQDAFLTDRTIYSMVKKHSSWLLKREDGGAKLLAQSNLFQEIPYVELIDVDRVQAGCRGIHSDCTFKRSLHPLPEIMNGYNGPLISAVTSLDGSITLKEVDYGTYVSMTKVKTHRFNKTKYYWFKEGYLYIPNVDWDAVSVEALFEGDVSHFACNDCGDDNCTPMQQQSFNLPPYLYGELEGHVIQDLRNMLQIPQDLQNDKQSITR
jgi:hypothetical protein